MSTKIHTLVTSLLRSCSSQPIYRFASTSTGIQKAIVNIEEPDQLFKTVEVEVRGADPAVLRSYEWFARTTASNLGIAVGNCWSPKGRKDRLTLLKSVHIYKKHRVQYEIRTHFTHMNFHKLTGSTADTFIEYIQRNLPEGVAMKVTKTAVERLPEPIQKFQAAS